MTATEVAESYGYEVRETDHEIIIGNIHLYYDREQDVIYAQRVKMNYTRAMEFRKKMMENYEPADELGWFKYQGDEIVVAVQADLSNMFDYYIYFRLVDSDQPLITNL